MAVQGTLIIDGQASDATELSLLASDGHTVAATRSGSGGEFSFGPDAAVGAGWVVAKLRGPVVGAAAAPVDSGSADGEVRIEVSTRDAVWLRATIELPPGAAAVSWFDVGVTPTALDGVPAQALDTLTLDGVGPARALSFHSFRISGTTFEVRVLPGTYDVRVAHVVESGKVASPPPSWKTGNLVLPGGLTVPADLGYVPVELRGDVEARVVMVPAPR